MPGMVVKEFSKRSDYVCVESHTIVWSFELTFHETYRRAMTLGTTLGQLPWRPGRTPPCFCLLLDVQWFRG